MPPKFGLPADAMCRPYRATPVFAVDTQGFTLILAHKYSPLDMLSGGDAQAAKIQSPEIRKTHDFRAE